jgi:hypothetical protein
MNKILKFKVLDLKSDKYLDSYNSDGLNFYYNNTIYPITYFLDNKITSKNFTVLQHIFYSEEIEQDIYEGDVLEYSYKTSSYSEINKKTSYIGWNQNRKCWGFFNLKTKKEEFSIICDYWLEIKNKIGNIYEQN